MGQAQQLAGLTSSAAGSPEQPSAATVAQPGPMEPHSMGRASPAAGTAAARALPLELGSLIIEEPASGGPLAVGAAGGAASTTPRFPPLLIDPLVLSAPSNSANAAPQQHQQHQQHQQQALVQPQQQQQQAGAWQQLVPAWAVERPGSDELLVYFNDPAAGGQPDLLLPSASAAGSLHQHNPAALLVSPGMPASSSIQAPAPQPQQQQPCVPKPEPGLRWVPAAPAAGVSGTPMAPVTPGLLPAVQFGLMPAAPLGSWSAMPDGGSSAAARPPLTPGSAAAAAAAFAAASAAAELPAAALVRSSGLRQPAAGQAGSPVLPGGQAGPGGFAAQQVGSGSAGLQLLGGNGPMRFSWDGADSGSGAAAGLLGPGSGSSSASGELTPAAASALLAPAAAAWPAAVAGAGAAGSGWLAAPLLPGQLLDSLSLSLDGCGDDFSRMMMAEYQLDCSNPDVGSFLNGLEDTIVYNATIISNGPGSRLGGSDAQQQQQEMGRMRMFVNSATVFRNNSLQQQQHQQLLRQHVAAQQTNSAGVAAAAAAAGDLAAVGGGRQRQYVKQEVSRQKPHKKLAAPRAAAMAGLPLGWSAYTAADPHSNAGGSSSAFNSSRRCGSPTLDDAPATQHWAPGLLTGGASSAAAAALLSAFAPAARFNRDSTTDEAGSSLKQRRPAAASGARGADERQKPALPGRWATAPELLVDSGQQFASSPLLSPATAEAVQAVCQLAQGSAGGSVDGSSLEASAGGRRPFGRAAAVPAAGYGGGGAGRSKRAAAERGRSLIRDYAVSQGMGDNQAAAAAAAQRVGEEQEMMDEDNEGEEAEDDNDAPWIAPASGVSRRDGGGLQRGKRGKARQPAAAAAARRPRAREAGSDGDSSWRADGGDDGSEESTGRPPKRRRPAAVEATDELPAAVAAAGVAAAAAGGGRGANTNPGRGPAIGHSSTSGFKGVTKHRWTGKWEAHLWDANAPRKNTGGGGRTRGKQVYLGGFSSEDAAANAYDRAAIAYWGDTAKTNFSMDCYDEEIDTLTTTPRDEVVAALRRGSCSFVRGSSRYRGVGPYHQPGKWEARIGRAGGQRYQHLGVFEDEAEAAKAYDRAALAARGMGAITNFPKGDYLT